MRAGGPTSTPGFDLQQRGLKPRKRLGQNFLRDRRYLARIVGAAELEPGDRVLEIGAGTGMLTRALADAGAEVLAIELDDSLFEHLTEEFRDVPTIGLWHGNALAFDPCQQGRGPYKLVGNIPYYITGPILRHFLTARCPPSLTVIMVQREVAERMAAGPGDLSLLGVSVQYYALPRIVTRVPRQAFYPAPKVESAVVRLDPREPAGDEEAFFTVARAGFGQRRKQLANALSAGLGIEREHAQELLSEAHVDPRRRAETLALEEWHELAEAWARRGRS